MIAFGLAVRNPAFHKVAQRLGQKENLENIIATVPDLAKVTHKNGIFKRNITNFRMVSYKTDKKFLYYYHSIINIPIIKLKFE